MESTFYKTTFIGVEHATCRVPRASHPSNDPKRIESEVIASKSLKKGVLTLVTWAGAVYPAGCRQRAQLGLAFTRRAHGSSFMGPLSSLSIPLPVFLGPMVTYVQERRLGT